MVPTEETRARLEGVDTRLDDLDGRVEAIDRLDKGMHALSGSLARLERKLDRILALSVEARNKGRP